MTALEEIKKALDGVTPVTWSYQFTEENGEVFIIANELGGLIGAALPWPTEVDEKDFRRVVAYAKYIAAANPVAISEILSTLESLQRENEELRRDKDRIGAEKAGIAKNAHSNVDYWKSQAEAAEAEVKRLEAELALSKPVYSRRQIEARVKSLEEALKPFAEYMGDHFDKDNHGNPLPDDLGVGWIYLTHADFRRARTALASTGGEHNGN